MSDRRDHESSGCSQLLVRTSTWEDYVSLVWIVRSNPQICLCGRCQGMPPLTGFHNSPPFNPPLLNQEVDVEEVRVPDALSSPNEIQISQPFRGACQTDAVGSTPLEIHLSQDNPGSVIIVPSFSAVMCLKPILLVLMMQGIFGVPSVAPSVNVEKVCTASNSVDMQMWMMWSLTGLLESLILMMTVRLDS